MPVKGEAIAGDMEVYPEQDAVYVNFRGAYEDLWQGYNAVYAYMAEHGLEQNGNPQEVYYESINTAFNKDCQYLTRVIVPVKKV